MWSPPESRFQNTLQIPCFSKFGFQMNQAERAFFIFLSHFLKNFPAIFPAPGKIARRIVSHEKGRGVLPAAPSNGLCGSRWWNAFRTASLFPRGQRIRHGATVSGCIYNQNGCVKLVCSHCPPTVERDVPAVRALDSRWTRRSASGTEIVGWRGAPWRSAGLRIR
jgi:hypothetical protein